MFALSSTLSLLLAVTPVIAQPPVKEVKSPGKVEAPAEKKTPPADAHADKHPPQYTTYFYTAGEAVVHGYEADTKVRIVSLDRGGTIWQGTIGIGQTQTVQTGRGVFGFLSDKKASILVGTPTSCAVVGYFLKDQNGEYRSNHFFTQLPSTTYSSDERVIAWAYENAHVQVIDRKTEKVLHEKDLEPGQFIELKGEELVGNRVLEFKSTGSKIAVEVYYDEGFIVPASNGRGSGTDFFTYVGTLTTGENDINVVSEITDANVTITDLKEKAVLWKGVVKRGAIQTLTLRGKYVRVQSDKPVNVVEAAFKHYQAGYAEHHFGTGLEGGGIDNEFMVTTSGELWLFSYFDGNPLTVTNALNGEQVFAGTLNAGGVKGLTPGFGLFRVKSQMGMSVMGGASSCGADYSPAAGMFAVDEGMFAVLAQVRDERMKEAAKQGRTLTEAAAAAPLTADEWNRNQALYKEKSNAPSISLEEANQRAAAIQKQ